MLPGDSMHGANVGQHSRQAVVYSGQALLLVQGLPAGVQRSEILQVVSCLVHAICQLHKPPTWGLHQSCDWQAAPQDVLTAIATDIRRRQSEGSLSPENLEPLCILVSVGRHQRRMLLEISWIAPGRETLSFRTAGLVDCHCH